MAKADKIAKSKIKGWRTEYEILYNSESANDRLVRVPFNSIEKLHNALKGYLIGSKFHKQDGKVLVVTRVLQVVADRVCPIVVEELEQTVEEYFRYNDIFDHD